MDLEVSTAITVRFDFIDKIFDIKIFKNSFIFITYLFSGMIYKACKKCSVKLNFFRLRIRRVRCFNVNGKKKSLCH